MKFKIRLKIIITFVLLFITGNQLSFGKFFSPPKDSLYEDQYLNGHKFMINSLVGSPFIQTYLQNRLGGGRTIDLTIPEIKIDTQHVIDLKGDLVSTTLDIEYQQAIKKWMAFRIKINIAGKSGTEAGALLSEGVNVVFGYELGWLFKLYRTKEFALSGSLDLLNRSYTIIDLQSYIKDIIDSGRVVKSEKFVTNVSSLRAGGTLKGSYAFNQTFGFTGNINALYGESVDRTSKGKWFFEYGGLFDADLLPKQNVPIGFLVGFYHTALPTTSDQTATEPNNLLAGINYTGRRDLNLGLELNYQVYRPTGFDESIKIVSAIMNFRYFF